VFGFTEYKIDPVYGWFENKYVEWDKSKVKMEI